MTQSPLIHNRVEFLVVSDIYTTGVNDDDLFGEDFSSEDMVREEVLIKHTIVISLEDEFRECYDTIKDELKPEWTVIDRSGQGTHFITVAHSYTEVKTVYRRLEDESATFIHRYTKVENE